VVLSMFFFFVKPLFKELFDMKTFQNGSSLNETAKAQCKIQTSAYSRHL